MLGGLSADTTLIYPSLGTPPTGVITGGVLVIRWAPLLPRRLRLDTSGEGVLITYVSPEMVGG